uniref:Uncharacterized protein n=1 Tax=Noccaea caerulescens TaxID=107243 RepID=A0A1J3F5U2_NOCCA
MNSVYQNEENLLPRVHSKLTRNLLMWHSEEPQTASFIIVDNRKPIDPRPGFRVREETKWGMKSRIREEALIG